jgi:endoglycosylceramidase
MTRGDLTALALVLGVAACGAGGAGEPPCTGGFHVCRGQIRDADGRAVILRGINISGGNKAAPYLDYHQAGDVARIRHDWSMNAVRWVMPWAAVEPTRGGYDDAYLDQVRTRLDWARDNGVLVVLDMHQDVYGEGFGYNGAPRWTCDEARYAAFVPHDPWPINYTDPNVIACFDALWTDDALGAAFAAAWQHVAARLGDHPAVLGFDVINEPHWGSYPVVHFERDRLAPFEARVITAVRAAAPGWLAFVEPASSRNLGIPTSLTRFDAGDIVYAPHAYDAQAEQGHGFDPARRDDFVENLALLRQEADALGAALWIGEYGGLESDPQVGAYMAAAYDGAAAARASTMYWDDARGGYGPTDADGHEVAAITDAIVRPYPARIAGDPEPWSYDPATRALTVRWRGDAAIAAPTEIVWPARLAPAGVAVACDGCASTVDGDVVSISGTGGGDVTVTLTPR